VKKTYLLILLRVLWLLLTVLLISLWFIPYENIVTYITDQLGGAHVEAKIRNQWLSYSKYILFEYIILFIIIILVWTGYSNWNNSLLIEKILIIIHNYAIPIGNFKDQLIQLPRVKLVLLVGCWTFWMVIRLAAMVLLPITTDEANVWQIFVRRGWLVACSYYPIPSNHIFYTLCVIVTSWLSVSNELALRLPAYLAGAGLLLSLFYVLYQRLGFIPALTGLWLAGGNYALFLYGILGRGYGFLALLGVILIHITLRIIEKKARAYHYNWSIVTAALGMYTIPVFVYVCLPVWSVIISIRGIGYGIAWLIKVTVLTLFFYLPVLFVSGSMSVVQFYAPDPNRLFWPYWLFRWDFIGLVWGRFEIFILLSMSILAAILSLRLRWQLVFLILLFIIPMVADILQGFSPPDKAITPLAAAAIITWLLLLKTLRPAINYVFEANYRKWIITVCFLIYGLGSMLHFYWRFNYSYSAETAAAAIVKKMKALNECLYIDTQVSDPYKVICAFYQVAGDSNCNYHLVPAARPNNKTTIDYNIPDAVSAKSNLVLIRREKDK
jgi:hypothetical protein